MDPIKIVVFDWRRKVRKICKFTIQNPRLILRSIMGRGKQYQKVMPMSGDKKNNKKIFLHNREVWHENNNFPVFIFTVLDHVICLWFCMLQVWHNKYRKKTFKKYFIVIFNRSICALFYNNLYINFKNYILYYKTLIKKRKSIILGENYSSKSFYL